MACIIKKPDETRGIISFTSPEHREVITGETKQFLIDNRDKWIYLQHHNWQPCESNDFYDSNLCNHHDLTNSGSCLDMDCCNFSPSDYEYGNNERFFDVLYVARCVSFKRINVFFSVCKELLRQRPETKILFVCPIPDEDCDPKDPKSIYLNMFSREREKTLYAYFLIMTILLPYRKKSCLTFINHQKFSYTHLTTKDTPEFVVTHGHLVCL